MHDMPPSTPPLCRRESWAADLTRGLRTGVQMRVPQPNMPGGSPGAVLVAVIVRQQNFFSGHQCQPSEEITVSW
jgi:hypothetical protein